MKKVKKIIGCLLAALMLLSLAACSGDEISDGSGKVTVSWARVFDTVENADYYTQDAVYQYVSDTYNIDFEIIPLTWGNAVENVRIWMNSGDMPDVVSWLIYNHEEFLSFVDQGLVRKFNDDWKERWPNAARVYETTGLGEELENILGGTYCFPSPIYFNHKPADVLSIHIQTYFRKDWVEAVGFEAKNYYTVDELLDIARALKTQDPGNVGPNFYPITADPSMIAYVFPYALYTHTAPDAAIYKGGDGQYRWGPADEETYTALKIFQDAYREGLIHPEFYTLQLGEALDMMSVAGLSAINIFPGIARAYRDIAVNLADNLGLNPDDALLSSFILGQDGKYHGTEIPNYFGALLFRHDMTDEEFERVMDAIDYSVTEAGQNMFHLGIEGESFAVAADGSLEMLVEGTPNTVYPSISFFDAFAAREDDFGLIDPSMPAAYRQKQIEQFLDKYNMSDSTTLAPIDWRVTFHNSDANRMAQLTYNEEYCELILRDGDLRANWEAWVRDKMQLIQPVLDELNAG